MTRSAARKGLSTTVWDRSPERASGFASDKVRLRRTPVDAVQNGGRRRHHGVGCGCCAEHHEGPRSSGGHEAGRSLDTDVDHRGRGHGASSTLAATRPEIVFLDAPVSGSKAAAEQAKLVILASGDRARAGATVQEFFDAIGAQTHWLGDVGQGTRMKLLFNAWLGVLMEGVAEVAILGDTLGVDQGRFAALVSGGPLVPPWAVAKLEKIKEGRTAETEFPLRWAHKDVQLALAAAGEERSRLPILNKIEATWADADRDFGAADLSAIYVALSNGVKQ